MKRWILAEALAFAAAGHTLASDLPPPGVPPAPPRAPAAYVPSITPAYNWGGIYFGLNLGYGFGTSNRTDPNGCFQRATKGGWTAGAGIEAGLWRESDCKNRISLHKAGKHHLHRCGSDLGGSPNDTVKFSTSTIRLGIDYKLR
jgi:opacity protein-like surface antigen